MFIFIFQTIWLFIDDLAGKGLDIIIIGKFLFYLMPNLTEKVLPLTVLLSSILTFGTFAENYEFAAMKASGISLQRAMRSLIVFVVFLAFVTFYFANSVIPASEQKIYNLRKNIAKVKPAAIITEGVFSDLEGTNMNMKVDRKYGENDRFLENVIIHQKSKTGVNTTVIKAKEGELISSEKSDILQLVLKDGNYYETSPARTAEEKKTNPFRKSYFKVYTINKDISGLNDVDLEEERNVSTDKMKNISRLVKDIDSIKKYNLKVVNSFSRNISSRMGAFISVANTGQNDTLGKKRNVATNSAFIQVKKTIDSVAQDTTALALEMEEKTYDSIPKGEIPDIPVEDVVRLYKDWQRVQLVTSAKNFTTNALNTIEAKKKEIQNGYKRYNLHILSYHKKFALALSCIILFFVGAPLGAIIRKGGLGLPMVIAIILFLTYYFLGVFSGNYAKEGNIHPIFGAWLPTLIMLPLGIFLTRRATADRGLVDLGVIGDFFKKLFKKKNKVSEI
ncbi:LptF/LptG family permease [Spongiimicrobium salis]|uniref:LptF/LptG family permease n=1 Tax=Spongiimicrobium salis TaxID=1667022 RepID=UPI00374D3955